MSAKCQKQTSTLRARLPSLSLMRVRSPQANPIRLRPAMRLARVAMRALEPPRDEEQRRLHVEMMLFGKRTRFRRHAVPARITA